MPFCRKLLKVRREFYQFNIELEQEALFCHRMMNLNCSYKHKARKVDVTPDVL